MSSNNNTNGTGTVLMPINQDFLDVFKDFMNSDQRAKVRAHNVRQYTEGIIDLLLKDKITPFMKATERYENLSWKRKLDSIRENYNPEIAEDIDNIFKIGGEGSHFNGDVSTDNLYRIIELANHLVENIFVKYFLEPEHQFGNENIFTIFSMLPLANRIYILEKISCRYLNEAVIDRLSLAYTKNGEKCEAIKLLDKALQQNVITSTFYATQLIKLTDIEQHLPALHEKNGDYGTTPEYSQAIIADSGNVVVGLPTSKDIFDTKKAFDIFKEWFENDESKYPEFINLFFCLMATDTRQYTK